MQHKITPNIWFNRNALEAAEYYKSVFPDAKIISTTYYPQSKEDGLADFQLEFAGKPLTVEFEIFGMRIIGINAGDEFKLSEAVSFAIECEDQEEIDYYWEKLSKVPEVEQCGWCKDQFGLSWQVTPPMLSRAITDKDSARAARAMSAMMQMKKIIIADIEAALKG